MNKIVLFFCLFLLQGPIAAYAQTLSEETQPTTSAVVTYAYVFTVTGIETKAEAAMIDEAMAKIKWVSKSKTNIKKGTCIIHSSDPGKADILLEQLRNTRKHTGKALDVELIRGPDPLR